MPPTDSGLPRGVYAHGNGFRTRVRAHQGGELRWEFHTDAAELDAWARAARAAVKAKQPHPPKPWASKDYLDPDITFMDFAERFWLPEHCRSLAPSTRNKHLLRLRRLENEPWANQALHTIKQRPMQDWINRMLTPIEEFEKAQRAGKKHELPAISRTELGLCAWMLRKIFSKAIGYDEIPKLTKNPALALTIPEAARNSRPPTRRRKPIGLGDLRALLYTLHVNDRLPFVIGFTLGTRVGETFGIAVEHWNDRTRRIDIEDMYGYWAEEVDGGERRARWIKDWTKNDDSTRYMYVADSVGDFISNEIERIYGHSPARVADGTFLDPWWYEPVDPAYAFDPLIRVNADLRVCVGTAGPGSGNTARDNTFRNRLKRAGHGLGLEIGLDYAGDMTTVRPHDLRKSVSALLHEHGHRLNISDRARSAYLGHALIGAWDSSPTTSRTYTPEIEAAMHNIAGAIETEFVPFLAPFEAPPLVTDGPDQLVQVGYDQVTKRFGFHPRTVSAKLHAAGVQPVINPYRTTDSEVWWRLGDVERVLAGQNEGVAKSDVAAALYPNEDVEPRTLKGRLQQLVKEGHLTHSVSASRKYPRYTSDSVERATQLLRHIAEGRLRPDHEIRGRLGLSRAELSKAGIGTTRIAGIHYVDVQAATQHLEALAELEGQVVPRDEAAALLGVSRTILTRLLRDMGITASMRLHAAELAELQATLAERLPRIQAGRIVDVQSKPNRSDWSPLENAAVHLRCKESTLLNRAKREGWSLRRHDAVVYVSRTHLRVTPAATADEVTTDQLCRLLHAGDGEPTNARRQRIRQLVADGVVEGRRVSSGGLEVLYVSRTSVRDWLLGLRESGELLIREQVAERLGLSVPGVQAEMRAGRLKPAFSTALHGAGVRQYLFWAKDVEALLDARTPPPGWLRLHDVAVMIGASKNTVVRMLSDGQLGPVRKIGITWWIAPETAEAAALQRDPGGMVPGRDLLDAAGLGGRVYKARLNYAVNHGKIPGAVFDEQRRLWLYPPSLVHQLSELLSVDASRSEKAFANSAERRAARQAGYRGGDVSADAV